jgi:putative transposase
MERYAISDHTWEALAPLLPGRPGTSGRRARDNRLFLDAVVWVLRNGGPWRDLPERFGNWNSAWRRFDRWSKNGVWFRLFEASQQADLEWIMIDSTTVRAHQHAAGARKRGTRPTSLPPARGLAAAVVA